MNDKEIIKQIEIELDKLKKIDYSKSENEVLQEKNTILLKITNLLSQIETLKIEEEKQIRNEINNIIISNVKEDNLKSIEQITAKLNTHIEVESEKEKTETEQQEITKNEKIDKINDELESYTNADYTAKITLKRGRLIREVQREIAKIKKSGKEDEKTIEVLNQLENKLQVEIEKHKNQLNDRYNKEFLDKDATVPAIITTLPKGVALQVGKIDACIKEIKAAKTNKQRIFGAINLIKAFGMTLATPVIFTVKFIVQHWYLLTLLLSLIKLPGLNHGKGDSNDHNNDINDGKNLSKVSSLASEKNPDIKMVALGSDELVSTPASENVPNAVPELPNGKTPGKYNDHLNLGKSLNVKEVALGSDELVSTPAPANVSVTGTELPNDKTPGEFNDGSYFTETPIGFRFTDEVKEKNFAYELARAFSMAQNHSYHADSLIFKNYEEAANYVRENIDLDYYANLYFIDVKNGNYDEVIHKYLTSCDPNTGNLHPVQWLVGEGGWYQNEQELLNAYKENALLGENQIESNAILYYLGNNPLAITQMELGYFPEELANSIYGMMTPVDFASSILLGVSPGISEAAKNIETVSDTAKAIAEKLLSQIGSKALGY